jgi:hypothetical protein
MGSAIRTILVNPLYTGRVRWNTGGYVRDPDTAKRVWRERPQGEWVEHRDEYKRRELADARPPNISESAKLLTILPNAAELYRRQIALGLDGAHPQIALKARLALRELLGQIRLEPGEGGSLWTAYEIQPRC